MNTTQHNRLILEVKRDTYMGGLGLLPVDVKPKEGIWCFTQGNTLAHDLIEHPFAYSEMGTVQDELQAEGAAWFTRGQYADYTGEGYIRWTPEEILKSSIINLARDYIDNKEKPCIALQDIDYKNHLMLDVFESVVFGITVKDIIDEHYNQDEENPKYIESKAKEYLSIVVPMLCRGYNICAAKYKDGLQANKLFWCIAEKFDYYFKHTDLIKGMQYSLEYGFKDDNGNAYCFIDEYYGEYEEESEENENE